MKTTLGVVMIGWCVACVVVRRGLVFLAFELKRRFRLGISGRVSTPFEGKTVSNLHGQQMKVLIKTHRK